MRVGVDIGGTKILAGIVDDNGNVVHTRRIATEIQKDYEGVRDDIINLIEKVVDDSQVPLNSIEQIGVATAGQIEKGTGRILFSPNMGWRNVSLGDDIEKYFRIRTCVENDVNAATYGEWIFSFNKIPRDLLGIYIGTGIGGGLILDGKLYRGFTNVGGEVGHTILNPHGYLCNCGNRGCFEAYCGGGSITERVRRKVLEGYRGPIWDIINGNIENIHSGSVEEAYFSGDEFCSEVWKEVIEYLGAGVASLVNLLNPEVVLLGGGVIYNSKSLVEDMKLVFEKRVMKASLEGIKMEKVRLGENAALLGVSYIDTLE